MTPRRMETVGGSAAVLAITLREERKEARRKDFHQEERIALLFSALVRISSDKYYLAEGLRHIAQKALDLDYNEREKYES